MNPDFYVGYQPAAPPALRRTLIRVSIALALLSISIAAILTRAQGPFADSRFEYGVYRLYEGEIVEWPYPALLTADARFLLVRPGKFGAADLVRGHEGERVSLRAALISRGPDRMLEIDPATLRFSPPPAASRHPNLRIDLGPVTLTGEIVDTKCHLGVMNPGDGKVHRDCAVRCISGGAPPGFLVRDRDGETRLLLLAGPNGRPIAHEILDYVAEPVRISGQLVRTGPALTLLADPHDIRRE